MLAPLTGLTILAGGACASSALREVGTPVRPAPWPEADAPLRWVTTGAPADDANLAAWRAGVGEPILLGQHREPTGQEATPLVFVTWNVHVGGGDLAALVGDLRRGILTGGVPVTRFVLLLQEVHRQGELPVAPGARQPRRIEAHPPEGVRADLVEVARSLELNAVYAPSMGNGRAADTEAWEDRGNAIVSSLELWDPVAIELPYEGQRRVAVGARIDVDLQAGPGPGRSIRVVSAHLDNRTRWSRVLDSFGAARTRQAQALAAALPDDHVVLGADLNTWAPGLLEAAPEVLAASFPDTHDGGEATFRLAGVLGRRLDHLLLRLPDGMSVDVRVVPDRYGSDHHPVLAVVGDPQG